MKKLVFLAIAALSFSLASQAQTETKVKKTTNPTQAVHNVFHKHKHHNGYKVKTTKADGTTDVKKVKKDQ